MQNQQTSRTKNTPVTIKGAWHLVKRVMAENDTGARVPTLKQYAWLMSQHINAGTETARDPIVIDAVRWLAAKRPGGTDAERQARRSKRKEQRSIRASSTKSSKGALVASGKKKGKGNG